MKNLFFISLSVFLLSCSGEPEEQVSADGFQLPDSLFAFKDLENTYVIDSMAWDNDGGDKIYTHSNKSKSYIELDSAQIMHLLAPVVDIDSNYIVEYMDALFISKNKKTGEFTPITVYLFGDDYAALHYIVLDASMKPVSSYVVNGGEAGGPFEKEDGTLVLPPVIHSFFKDNKFYNFSVTETARPNAIPHPSIFDSVYFENEILPIGKIRTKKLDSIRFERMSEFD